MRATDSKILSRREIIHFYIEYDTKKKGKLLPDNIDAWDWDDPNDIDRNLKNNKLKYGVIAGFKNWELMQLSIHDLLQCAIARGIKEFENIPSHDQQVLNRLIQYKEFEEWKPHYQRDWYDSLETGSSFSSDWAMILRPSVSSEAPAEWYIEDGSGRAICFLRRLLRQNDEKSLAYGYLGKDPDPNSEFMNNPPFYELLN